MGSISSRVGPESAGRFGVRRSMSRPCRVDFWVSGWRGICCWPEVGGLRGRGAVQRTRRPSPRCPRRTPWSAEGLLGATAGAGIAHAATREAWPVASLCRRPGAVAGAGGKGASSITRCAGGGARRGGRGGAAGQGYTCAHNGRYLLGEVGARCVCVSGGGRLDSIAFREVGISGYRKLSRAATMAGSSIAAELGRTAQVLDA